MLPSREALLLRCVLRYLYCSTVLVGIMPFGARIRRFVWCRVRLTWSVLVGLGTIGAVGFSFYRIVTLIEYPSIEIVRYLFYYEFVLRFGILSSCYVLVWVNIRRLRVCGNTVVVIFEKLRRFNVPWMDKKLVWYGVTKIVLVDITMCCLFAINFRFNKKSDPVPAFERAMNVYAVFVAAQVSNVCLCTMYLTSYLFRAINWQIRVITRSLCDCDVEVLSNGYVAICYLIAHLYRQINLQIADLVQKLCNFGSDHSHWSLKSTKQKQLFRQIATELDRLAYLHRDVTTVVQWFVKIFDFSLLVMIVWDFFIVMFAIFYTYTSLVQDIRDNVRPPWSKYGQSCSVAIFQAFQFYYIVSASALVTRRAEKTGLVLNRFFRAEVTERVEKAIEMFTIELLHQPYSIENCGMFKVDFTLMYSMVATITSYLIIMIQFQLSE
ncbi:hypothetical protein pipiens_004655 [Culex pipiens pipiens]|uniref:Gustatory receptor n=1 Tax=Culex pipiens pipiens TaxID=38569 RepID=A0ABD1CGG2_CULPP